MKDQIIIKRYADAYIGYASQTSGLEQAFADFKHIKSVIRNNPEFLNFLQHPEITQTEKSEFLERLLGEDFSEEFRQFLKLLLAKERVDKLFDIAEYIRVHYSYGEELEALLKTTFPLDLDTIKQIKEKLELKFKRKFRLYIGLDGSLLGGVQVIIGNTVIDASVRRKLLELREQLSAVRLN